MWVWIMLFKTTKVKINMNSCIPKEKETINNAMEIKMNMVTSNQG
jgi:hypothetical protein